jgi:hypothetical protein
MKAVSTSLDRVIARRRMRDLLTIAERVSRAFQSSGPAPRTSLRGGDALDVYKSPHAFDPELDEPSDAYLGRHAAGLAHLDPETWLYYLPLFLTSALRNASEPGNRVVEAVLWSPRPPDREPARLGALSEEQTRAVTEALEFLAFSAESQNQDFALQVLEEYWIPGALYRKT